KAVYPHTIRRQLAPFQPMTKIAYQLKFKYTRHSHGEGPSGGVRARAGDDDPAQGYEPARGGDGTVLPGGHAAAPPTLRTARARGPGEPVRRLVGLQSPDLVHYQRGGVRRGPRPGDGGPHPAPGVPAPARCPGRLPDVGQV